MKWRFKWRKKLKKNKREEIEKSHQDLYRFDLKPCSLLQSPRISPLEFHYQLEILSQDHPTSFLRQDFTQIQLATFIVISMLQESETFDLQLQHNLIQPTVTKQSSYLSISLSQRKIILSV